MPWARRSSKGMKERSAPPEGNEPSCAPSTITRSGSNARASSIPIICTPAKGSPKSPMRAPPNKRWNRAEYAFRSSSCAYLSSNKWMRRNTSEA